MSGFRIFVFLLTIALTGALVIYSPDAAQAQCNPKLTRC
jgi:uncharacterized iron-regulated membrane protein